MQAVYAHETLPTTVTGSIFLAGPTPRDSETASWRSMALQVLESLKFPGHVFVPEARDGVWKDNYESQVEWEEAALNRADVIVFWVPRDMASLPGLTTNIEWGAWHDSGKVIWGAPSHAAYVRYPEYYAKKASVPVCSDLEETLALAVERIGQGAERTGGETEVPLHIWKQKEFQAWLAAQKKQGNRLDGARVLWAFFPKPGFLFSYVLKVDVHASMEDRNKKNEWVFFRKDISTVVLYELDDSMVMEEMRVALIREFRSPVRNRHAFVYELPGGSSVDDAEAPEVVAAHEVKEETGLGLDPDRLWYVGARQPAATLSAHVASVYACRLTKDEMDKLAADKAVHGNVADTERTYVEVWTVKQLLSHELSDWTTLGMVMSVFAHEMGGS